MDFFNQDYWIALPTIASQVQMNVPSRLCLVWAVAIGSEHVCACVLCQVITLFQA
jgi:hypothetical protein